MNIQEYIKNATRTESVIKNDSNNYRVLHANIGIITEVGEILDSVKKSIYYGKEYDFINLQEEIGDVMWYLAILCDEKKVELEKIFNNFNKKYQPPFKASNPLEIIPPAIRINGLANRYAKLTNYSQSPDSSIDEDEILNFFFNGNESKSENFITALVEPISEIIYLSGSNLEDICEQNIRKLKKRFPEKFTSDKALNRDLDQEREALEQN
jgi:NTP pyrophosphatase (non-canonical NTP hydrolase)